MEAKSITETALVNPRIFPVMSTEEKTGERLGGAGAGSVSGARIALTLVNAKKDIFVKSISINCNANQKGSIFLYKEIAGAFTKIKQVGTLIATSAGVYFCVLSETRIFLKAGDSVRCEIEGLGSLSNYII